MNAHLTPDLVCRLAAPAVLSAALTVDGSTGLAPPRDCTEAADTDGVRRKRIDGRHNVAADFTAMACR